MIDLVYHQLYEFRGYVGYITSIEYDSLPLCYDFKSPSGRDFVIRENYVTIKWRDGHVIVIPNMEFSILDIIPVIL